MSQVEPSKDQDIVQRIGNRNRNLQYVTGNNRILKNEHVIYNSVYLLTEIIGRKAIIFK